LRNVVDLHDRLVTGSHFCAQQIRLLCDPAKTQSVLSGSTNWTMTGLCTQPTTHHCQRIPGCSGFSRRMESLKDAGTVIRQPWPPPFTGQVFQRHGGRITQWFVPTSAGQDLDLRGKLINARAKHSLPVL